MPKVAAALAGAARSAAAIRSNELPGTDVRMFDDMRGEVSVPRRPGDGHRELAYRSKLKTATQRRSSLAAGPRADALRPPGCSRLGYPAVQAPTDACLGTSWAMNGENPRIDASPKSQENFRDATHDGPGSRTSSGRRQPGRHAPSRAQGALVNFPTLAYPFTLVKQLQRASLQGSLLALLQLSGRASAAFRHVPVPWPVLETEHMAVQKARESRG